MVKWLGISLILTVALFVQACAPKSQDDCGFVQNVYGERISWKSDVPVTMYLHESVPDSMIPAIRSAAATWARTAGRDIIKIVEYPREMGPLNPHKDGRNVIYFMNAWEANRASEQGRTSVYWIGDLIKEADIRLNAADFSFYWNGNTLTTAAKSERKSSSPVNIEALVLHEMGHVLGLKHKDGSGSVMATYLSSGDDRVNLAGTDTASLQCEY
ncbi:matrixin family metalloprotease [Bdellovibrio bacteriovorus]|uniref:matrixin family metalloprotease n=1 Tax=Bdellovibrio bacteriovorus TaxID=959 RepID=UPI0021D37280|nr:matrixin family metalloprotease [Bdellovibrio bacteriovorus]UXR65041.1 matrixin family metalloprotease [Bdellovibrio bacteriovorus]